MVPVTYSDKIKILFDKILGYKLIKVSPSSRSFKSAIVIKFVEKLQRNILNIATQPVGLAEVLEYLHVQETIKHSNNRLLVVGVWGTVGHLALAPVLLQNTLILVPD